MNSFIMNMRKKLMVFGISILLCIYSVYIKFFGKDISKKTAKHSLKKGKNNAKKGPNNAISNGLKLFNLIDTLNSIKLLEKLLRINPTVVDKKDKNGNTPLMLSIIHNKNENVIEKIISYTSDFNIKNNNGDNCLMLAIANGNEKLVDLILQYNVNVNARNNQDESPLFLAIEKKQYNIVASLLNKNININYKNKKGKTPMEMALANEDMDLIKLLIENGATTLVKDANDEYIIFQLIEHPELFKKVIEIESNSPNKKNLILTLRNKQGDSLLMEFCRRGYIKLAKFMIKNKVDLNFVNQGESALTIAIREGQLDMVKLLLTCRSINIHHLTNDDKNPLRIAIENQNLPIVETLINYGGRLLLITENENLLKKVISIGNVNILNRLLDININVDVKFGVEKNTPLIYAIKKYLKKHHIDTSEEDDFNLSNLYSNDSFPEDDSVSTVSSNSSTTLAASKNSSITDNNYYSRIFTNIDQENDDTIIPLYVSDSDNTLSDHEENFEDKASIHSCSFAENELILPTNDRHQRSFSGASTSSIDDKISKRRNIINTDIPVINHRVSFDKVYRVKDESINVDNCYYDIIRGLLRKKAKVNLSNEYKDTALILACRYGLRNIVELLLKESSENALDIDVNSVDRYGNTALHNACKKNYTSIVRLLLAQESINVNIPNYNGNTALMLAVYENNVEIIHELLKCKGININPLNVQLETPLIAACRMNNFKIAKILLENEAIINKRYDLNGETALFHAVRNNNRKLASLLLDYEASISFKNKNGKSPLTIAKEYKYKNIVSLFYIYIKNQNTLKTKGSTLSLNENLIREEENKNVPHKAAAHSRHASINIASTTSSDLTTSSLINELKNTTSTINNAITKKANHTKNSSVTFSKPLVHSLVPPVNSKHTRQDSISSDGSVNKNSRKINGDLKHQRSRSNSLDYPVKMTSKPNLKKGNQPSPKIKSSEEEKSKSSSDEASIEATTELLLMKAKEKVQSINGSASTTTGKTVKNSKSQSSIKGEAKSDEYLKPLKTACYNQNDEDVLEFYKGLVQEKGNIYKLPEELFEQIKNLKDEGERAAITEKIKEFNKTREVTSTASSIDMFVFTLLYFSDNANAIETMLQYGLNPNMQNNAYYTLLILACKKNQPKSALVLLDYNADPNYQNKYDETALILACKKGMLKVIEKLIQCHANVNLRNDKGETALIMACWKKNIEIVKLLLETDVDVNMKNNLEESPLYLSCLQNSVDIAEMLLKRGADVNAANNKNETPIMIARQYDNKKMIDLLLKYGAKEEN
ncbi:ankyrin [Piromyces finnis]|uniref:Ankyrin n=1 Tax=Piromyces finnis TaxID=1754191 RepID=A0A1Y1VF61_9FUNG|nr:ankyrin [Piromyces finnis]|eukprot:ORX53883.1 ankyrin [Piromyces finnis]